MLPDCLAGGKDNEDPFDSMYAEIDAQVDETDTLMELSKKQQCSFLLRSTRILY